jgi:DNA-directed RNA polymerase
MRKSLECLFTEDEKAKIGKMDPFVEPEPADIFESNLEMSRQRQLEEGAYQSALETWKHEMDEALKRGDIYTNRLGLRGLTWDWVQAMKPVLEEHIERIRPKYVNSDGEPVYASIEKDTDPNKMEHIWLTALPTETLCAITIMEVIRSQANEGRSAGSKAGNLISTIGKAVEREIQAKDMIRRENKGLHPRHINLRQLLTKRNVAERYAANFHKELISGIKSGVSYWPFEWRHDIRARVSSTFNVIDVSVLQSWCLVSSKAQR